MIINANDPKDTQMLNNYISVKDSLSFNAFKCPEMSFKSTIISFKQLQSLLIALSSPKYSLVTLKLFTTSQQTGSKAFKETLKYFSVPPPCIIL